VKKRPGSALRKGWTVIATLLRKTTSSRSPDDWEKTVAAKYALHVAQHAAQHHFDCLRLALAVLEFDGEPASRAEWWLRVAEAAEKCSSSVDECISRIEVTGVE